MSVIAVGSTTYHEKEVGSGVCYVPDHDKDNPELTFAKKDVDGKVVFINVYTRSRFDSLPDVKDLPPLEPPAKTIVSGAETYKLVEKDGTLLYVPASTDDERHLYEPRGDVINQRHFFLHADSRRRVAVLPDLATLRDRVRGMFAKYTVKEFASIDEALDSRAGDESALIDELVKSYGAEPLHGTGLREILQAYFTKYDASRLPEVDSIVAQPFQEREEALASLEKQYGPAPPTYRQRITAIYEKYNPGKLGTVPDVMLTYEGREAQLLAALVRKYGEDPLGESQPEEDPEVIEQYRRRVRNMYRKYNPKKLSSVNHGLETYRGQEQLLIEALIKKYGPEPTEDELPEENEATSSPAKTPRTPRDAADPKMAQFRSRVEAMYRRYAPNKLELVDKALERYAGQEELLIETLVAKYGPEPQEGAASGSTSPRAGEPGTRSYRDRVVAMYTKYKPAMLSSVEKTLAMYEGNEEELLTGLVQKYGPEPADEEESFTRMRGFSVKSDAMRERLVYLLETHDPDRLGSVEQLLQMYAGREPELIAELEEKYGEQSTVEEPPAEEAPAEAPTEAVPEATAAEPEESSPTEEAPAKEEAEAPAEESSGATAENEGGETEPPAEPTAEATNDAVETGEQPDANQSGTPRQAQEEEAQNETADPPPPPPPQEEAPEDQQGESVEPVASEEPKAQTSDASEQEQPAPATHQQEPVAEAAKEEVPKETAAAPVELAPTAAAAAPATVATTKEEPPSEVSAAPSEPAAPQSHAVSSIPVTYEDRVKAMYATYNPSKMSAVPKALERYAGREADLLKALVQKYGPEPGRPATDGDTTTFEPTSDQAPSPVLSASPDGRPATLSTDIHEAMSALAAARGESEPSQGSPAPPATVVVNVDAPNATDDAKRQLLEAAGALEKVTRAQSQDQVAPNAALTEATTRMVSVEKALADLLKVAEKQREDGVLVIPGSSAAQSATLLGSLSALEEKLKSAYEELDASTRRAEVLRQENDDLSQVVAEIRRQCDLELNGMRMHLEKVQSEANSKVAEVRMEQRAAESAESVALARAMRDVEKERVRCEEQQLEHVRELRVLQDEILLYKQRAAEFEADSRVLQSRLERKEHEIVECEAKASDMRKRAQPKPHHSVGCQTEETADADDDDLVVAAASPLLLPPASKSVTDDSKLAAAIAMECEAVKRHAASLEAQLQSAMKDRRNLQDEYDVATRVVASLRNKNRSLEQHVESLELRVLSIPDVPLAVSPQEIELQTEKRRVEQLKKQIAGLEGQTSGYRKEIADLRGLLSMHISAAGKRR